MELTDFSVFYSQDSIAKAEATLKNKASKVVVEKGQIVKVSKDKNGIVTRELLTKHWTDWIDYWSVDFDFESKREIVRVQESGERRRGRKSWTGDYVFENEWQAFRTKKDRSLELKSVVARMHTRSPQGGGEGGGHFRQRHDDHRGSEYGTRGTSNGTPPRLPGFSLRHPRPQRALVPC